MSIDELKWAKDFPVIADDFDAVAFDLIKVDEEEPLYVIIVRYMITNEELQQLDGGVTIETGMSGSSYAECARLMDALVGLGFFHQSVSSMGTVYTEEGVEIEDVSWNDILESQNTKIPENVTLQ